MANSEQSTGETQEKERMKIGDSMERELTRRNLLKMTGVGLVAPRYSEVQPVVEALADHVLKLLR